MIRVPLPGKVRHLVQAHLDYGREQISQVCAFPSAFFVSISVIARTTQLEGKTRFCFGEF